MQQREYATATRPRDYASFERPTVDINSSIIARCEKRKVRGEVSRQEYLTLQPHKEFTRYLTTPYGALSNPSEAYTTKFIQASLNREKYPIFKVLWTPEGRRIITGAQSGEFTLWNGLHFNFETIVQAHESATHAMVWSHDEQTMISGDDNGVIKYWNSAISMLTQNVDAHAGGGSGAIRDISMAPTDIKFATGSDDHTVKVWDFNSLELEVRLDLGCDVKSVQWHPQKSLLLTGDRNSQVQLWDPKSGKRLRVLYQHKQELTKVRWNQNGVNFLSASKDQHIKLWDVRNLKQEVSSHRGHGSQVMSIQWHPVHENLWASGGYDGTIMYWLMDQEEPQAKVLRAHEQAVWDLAWHPVGHILVSSSNDRSIRFWTRNRPGDTFIDDQYNGPALEEAKRARADALGPTSSGAQPLAMMAAGEGEEVPGHKMDAVIEAPKVELGAWGAAMGGAAKPAAAMGGWGAAMGGGMTRGGGGAGMATGSCHAFARGECNRGDSCRYRHDGGGGGGGGGMRPTGSCHAFARGECNRGDSCRYRHDNASGGGGGGGGGGGRGGGITGSNNMPLGSGGGNWG